MNKKIKYKIGIDEVGRGPVAGPVAVGGVFYDVGLEKKLMEKLEGMTDSKKLSEKKREYFFKKIKILKSEKYFDKKLENLFKSEQKKFNSNKIFSSVVFVSAKDIDKIGIVPSIQKALNSVLENILKNEELKKINLDEIKILLDGGLKAPEKFKNQETIIKGDQKEFSISCASVVAKVIRDRQMTEYGNKFPQYYFEKHKGYGTKLHMETIKKHGICQLHRKTFLKNYL